MQTLAMTDKLWLPWMITLLGNVIVVTLTSWLSMRSVHARIDALRQETLTNPAAGLRGEMNAFRGELKLDLLRIENKLDHYAEIQADHASRIERLERRG